MTKPDHIWNTIPAAIVFPENHRIFTSPFNGFYLRIDKRRADNIRFICNYYCDSCIATEPPWAQRTLFSSNFADEDLSVALTNLSSALCKNDYLKYARPEIKIADFYK